VRVARSPAAFVASSHVSSARLVISTALRPGFIAFRKALIRACSSGVSGGVARLSDGMLLVVSKLSQTSRQRNRARNCSTTASRFSSVSQASRSSSFFNDTAVKIDCTT
jgi:hypothetical protein